MSIFGSVGIAAAERLERSAGPRVAMRSFEALLDGDEGVATRATAGYLRCLLALADEEARQRFAEAWLTVRRDPWPAVVDACRGALKKGQGEDAILIAETEAQRRDRALAWYLVARVHEQLGRGQAMLAGLRRAANAPDADVSHAARTAQIALLARAERPDPAVLERIPHEDLPPHQQLVVAVIQLASPRHEHTALEHLALLAKRDDAIGAQARRRAALHAERQGLHLRWRDAEPIVDAIMTAEPPASEAALTRLQARRPLEGDDPDDHALVAACRLARGGARHVDLCRAILDRVDIDPRALDEQGEVPPLVKTAMRAVHAMTHRDRRTARELLVALAHEDLRSAPAAVWTAGRLALDDPMLADRGVALMQALLASRAHPPRHYGAYVRALRRHGDDPTADELLRRGMARGETTAREALVESLVRSAWRAHAEGDDEMTLAALREAKALAAP